MVWNFVNPSWCGGDNMKVFIIIPAFNEGKKIGSVIKDLKKHNYNNIVVVDDSSKDKTSEVALKQGATVLRHIVNRGQGAAIETGNKYALRNGADIIVHFDADGQMQVKDIPAMIEPIKKGKADITMGSRFLSKTSNMPPEKIFILKIGNAWLRLFYGVKLSDPQCGFRALSKKGAQKLKPRQDKGGNHASEILIDTFKNKVKHKEVPVSILYTEYSMKHSQHGRNPLLHLLSGIKIVLKTIWSRLIK